MIKTKATAKDFIVPSGYQPVANEIQLLMGDDSLDFDELDKDINAPSKNGGAPGNRSESRNKNNSELLKKTPWGLGFPQ